MQLTTLANVKAWLSANTTDDDTLLTRLINQMSAATLSYLERPNIFRNVYTEIRDGEGNSRMTLSNWPVISLTSVNVFRPVSSIGSYNQLNTNVIPISTGFGQSGASITPYDGSASGIYQELVLQGYVFPRGTANVQAIYQAGYCILNEAVTLSGAAYTPLAPLGMWAQDDGITYASTGVALTPVATAPAQGQYVPPAPFAAVPTTAYTFSAADNGQALLVNYSYIPLALEEATIEWIGERYRARKRIGENSTSVGGQVTTSYYVKRIPEHIAQVLDPFKKWFAVA